MQIILRDVAAENGVALFRRFATMKAWVHSGQLRQTDILSLDGLHQNDLGYLCWADHLARALARSAGVAAPRPEAADMPVSRKNGGGWAARPARYPGAAGGDSHRLGGVQGKRGGGRLCVGCGRNM